MLQSYMFCFAENARNGIQTTASRKWGNSVTSIHIQENLMLKIELLITILFLIKIIYVPEKKMSFACIKLASISSQFSTV